MAEHDVPARRSFHRRRSRHCATWAPLFLVAITLPANAQWPEFRGPQGAATSQSDKLPLVWSEEKNVTWKTEIHGRAWSSPVIQDNQVWLTTASEDGRELSALAIDLDSGKILHDVQLFRVEKPQEIHPVNSYASPTPAIESGRVYVTFGYGGTAALDTRSAKVIWDRRDLQINHYRGPGASPILFRNLLIMHFDGSDRQFVIALDKLTGKTVWRTERSIAFNDLTPDGKPEGDGDFRKGFATPQIVTTGGAPVLVSLGSKAAYGYDPDTGKEKWRLEDRSSHTPSMRPVAGHGLVFFGTGWAGPLQAISLDPAGVAAPQIIWSMTRAVPKKPSIVLVGDLIFMVNDSGIVTCLEATTGKTVWTDRLPGEYSASPVTGAGRVYFFNEEGQTTVIEAARSFKVVAENHLDDGFMASAAVAGNSLVLRTIRHLYRIDEGGAARR
jgi:outer membrane protein assembly factor BamB